VKRRYRLRDQERFRQVRQTGPSYAHPYVILCVLPNGQAISRCGFIVSRRIGKAVTRNRARRRLSEVVRLTWDLVAPGWDMVWIARPAINETGFADLQQACVRLLRKSGALSPALVGGSERRGSTGMQNGIGDEAKIEAVRARPAIAGDGQP
jgi:ribonuclease P protein component